MQQERHVLCVNNSSKMLKEHYILSCELLREKIESFEKYPFHLPIIQHLTKIDLHKNVTFFIGENGAGKSTLLESIAINYGFNPEGWSKNFNFSTQDTHSELADKIRLAKGIQKPKDGYFLRAETFYNVASNIDKIHDESGWMYDSYGGKSLHKQSHGESFFSLFMNRFFGHGLYMLDEPEAALSPQRQLAFLVRMNELVKQKSQFIIVTHSPIILAYPQAKIIQFWKNGFEEISYKQTSYYELYKNFLNNTEWMLKHLGIDKDLSE